MPKNSRVLVVGTTGDYIDWIRSAYPERALFLTEPSIRRVSREERPGQHEEIPIELTNWADVRRALKHHLKCWNQSLTGVACFDCESMELASALASEFGLDYPSLESIRNCRDKYRSKVLWADQGITCPRVRPVNMVSEVEAFLLETESGLVLKPFAGSGSELVFKISEKPQCEPAFKLIGEGLEARRNQPLFQATTSPEFRMLAEEYIRGNEYSCDALLEKGILSLIRLTRKFKTDYQPFGTVSGYQLPPQAPLEFEANVLKDMLLKAVSVLGMDRGIFMVDFIVRDGQPFLIELTPRPGGDCLPFLIKEAADIDMLGLTLDFAEHKPFPIVFLESMHSHLAVRIFANKPGVLKAISTMNLSKEPRVKAHLLLRQPGHVITLPPADYGSWYLGHVIIALIGGLSPESWISWVIENCPVDISPSGVLV